MIANVMLLKIKQFIEGFNIWFKTLVRELANNVISVVFIIALYLVLWYFPQTTDLLIILNQTDAFFLEVPLYFASLMIAAFLIWNVPKYYYYHNYKDITLKNFIGFIPNQHYIFQYQKKIVSYPYLIKIHLRKTVPRILAVLVLAVSALSILHAMETFGLENSYTKYLDPGYSLFFAVLFLLLLSEPLLYFKIGEVLQNLPKTKYIAPVLSVILLLFMISLGTLNTQAEKDLGKLFLSNCALMILFFTLSFNSYQALKIFSRKIFYSTILISGFSIILLIWILNFAPGVSNRINPLSILVFSGIHLYMLCFILILLGKKIKFPLLTIVVLTVTLSAILFTNTSDHYQVSLSESDYKRPSLTEYVHTWIQDRYELIKNSNKPFSVLLVSAEGGGSRAGLWSSLVHSYLYETSDGRYFKHHLLSLSGASGGGVGNGMFFSVAQQAALQNKKASFRKENDEFGLMYKASSIYKKNYLSAALLSFLGRDLFKEITGLFTFDNRGEILENQWEKAHYEQFDSFSTSSLLEKEVFSFYNQENNAMDTTSITSPLLFVNTTHVQKGVYTIISPVTFDSLPSFYGMEDFYTELQNGNNRRSLKLSSALRMNASFPFITPVGEVENTNSSGEKKTDQYADAGYYDNIGGRVSRGVEVVLKQVLSDSFPDLVNKIDIKQVLIANEESRKIAKTETQLAAPLATLRNIRYGQTKEIEKQLGEQYAIRLKQTEINVKDSGNFFEGKEDSVQKIKPVLPLGRYLSTIAIRSMEERLVVIQKQLDSIL